MLTVDLVQGLNRRVPERVGRRRGRVRVVADVLAVDVHTKGIVRDSSGSLSDESVCL
jgi:hypothetical protein